MLTTQSQTQATTAPVYTDIGELGKLRHAAKADPQATLRQVAQQFEALFLQMALKSMRQASMGDPIFDSNQSDMYREMFDQQTALSMTHGKGIGLADALVRQLQGNLPVKQESDSSNQTVSLSAVYKTGSVMPVTDNRFSSEQEFVTKLWPLAEQAASKLNVSPEVLISQAALETGWGKHISRGANGQSSFNLFNIKADQRWQGNTLALNTLEFRDGVAVRENARFRAYSSYADSFNDYVDFLQTNPRYREALKNSHDKEEFVHQLQAAGYATDPDYADKVINIMQRHSVRQQVQANPDNAAKAMAG